ncbi:alpha/beta hydrolase [Acuticoccus yangtzensis]|uniref:alpha/beta hydrolase n=1 Tax=Acuticoccus yangtzensis TaxID=1443441 RepID=UPI00094988A8|nr:alpha/beta hydrolase family protein [Acuticoccus yangtzensis]ORE91507.1 Putative esterase [Stappia sp. 22II-S9-Z10]
MRTFLLVHGAWHGAWCWAAVRDRLEAAGHRVETPILSGLGEKADLLRPGITLNDWVDEVARLMSDKALTDVIVVGHSFAGSVVSGLAEAVPGRIDRLVYLDAMVLEGGEAPFDTMDPAIVEGRRAAAEAFSGGLTLPKPPAAALGVLEPEAAAFVEAHMTPHPFSTFVEPLALDRAPGEGFDCTYVAVTEPEYAPLVTSRVRAKAYGWDYREMRTGHDMMITMPDETAELLLALAES